MLNICNSDANRNPLVEIRLNMNKHDIFNDDYKNNSNNDMALNTDFPIENLSVIKDNRLMNIKDVIRRSRENLQRLKHKNE